jgi:hypothetical protein
MAYDGVIDSAVMGCAEMARSVTVVKATTVRMIAKSITAAKVGKMERWRPAFLLKTVAALLTVVAIGEVAAVAW